MLLLTSRDGVCSKMFNLDRIFEYMFRIGINDKHSPSDYICLCFAVVDGGLSCDGNTNHHKKRCGVLEICHILDEVIVLKTLKVA